MENKFTDEALAVYFKESYAVDNEVIEKLWNLAETEEEKAELKKLGFIRNSYESKAGRLTFAERKVNLESIEKSFDTLEKRFIKEIDDINLKAKKEFLAAMKVALKEKDYKGLAKLKYGTNGKLSKPYAAMMKNFFEIGKKTASDEMQVKVPVTDKDISGLYRAQALQIEAKINEEVANVAKEEALLAAGKSLDDAVILKRAEKALALKLSKITNASVTPAAGGAFNTWRFTVFETYPDKIYAFQYTAVLDSRTTNLCQTLNGRVVGPNDPDYTMLMPPNHIKCRSMWVEILKDEFIKPEIGKIPKSVNREATGYTNFQDLQKVKVYKPTVAPWVSKKKKEEVVNGVIDTIRARLK